MLAQQLALIADRLRDISAFGLHYSENIHDRQRYQAVQDLAIELLALATGEATKDFEPLRATVLSHPTPFVGGDGAVVDHQGRMLLIRRADNQLWAMPGGALEAGETPAEGVQREVFEETGVRCEALKLVGVFDSRRSNSPSRHHLYHIVFLCRPVDTENFGQGTHREEVIDVKWFGEQEIPTELDPGHRQRIAETFRFLKDDSTALFDR